MATVTYGELLAQCQPRPIRTPREHTRALAIVERWIDKPRKTAAERQMIELLATLVDQYEESQWPTPHASPGEILKFMLDERQMSQSELARRLAIPQSTIANVFAAAASSAKPTCSP